MNQIKITTADRMLRELELIEFLFRLQLSDEYDNDPYLTIIDGKGERINSRFMGRPFMLYSETELFNIQGFKQEFTDRFESAQNNTLLINQAKEIRGKASDILQYIKDNWNDDNYKVKEFIEWDKNKEIGDEKHSADVLVFDNLSINGVFYGRFMKLETITGSPDKYTFRYLTYNQTLVKVCEVVIAFVDMLFPSTTGERPPAQSNEAIKYKELEIEAGRYNRPEFDDAMQKSGFVKSEELQGVLDGLVAAKKADNPYWPMERPFAELRQENEALDEFLSGAEFEITGGLLAYHDALQEYHVEELLTIIGIPIGDLLNIIHTIKEGSRLVK